MAKAKIILSIIVLLLFITNYQICELVYFNDIDKWWELKQNIYNVIIAICLYIAYLSSYNKWQSFILIIGVGFAFNDVIDRLVFNINSYQLNDIISGTITLITAYYKELKNNER